MADTSSASRQPRCLYYLDGVFAIFILIVGLLICVIGADYLGALIQVSSQSSRGFSMSVPMSVMTSALLVLILGLALTIYGFKRLIADILGAMKSDYPGEAEVGWK